MLARLNTHYETWFQASEPNAAGRLGFWRILFVLMYLRFGVFETTKIPAVALWQPVGVFTWMDAPPPTAVIDAWRVLLVVGLFMLLVGYMGRLATLLVLVSGGLLDVLLMCYGKVDHGTIIFFHLVPAVMLFSVWGQTYSLAALQPDIPTQPHDGSWRVGWVLRYMLAVMAVLYATAGIHKLLGVWVTVPGVVSNIVLHDALTDLGQGRTPGPLTPVIAFGADYRLFNEFLRWSVIALETLFPLALINGPLRRLFVGSAILMHAGIYYAMGWSFTYHIVFFALFIDWQRLFDALRLNAIRLPHINRLTYHALGITLTAALSIGWYHSPVLLNTLRQVVTLDAIFAVATVAGIVVVASVAFEAVLWVSRKQHHLQAPQNPTPLPTEAPPQGIHADQS